MALPLEVIQNIYGFVDIETAKNMCIAIRDLTCRDETNNRIRQIPRGKQLVLWGYLDHPNNRLVDLINWAPLQFLSEMRKTFPIAMVIRSGRMELVREINDTMMGRLENACDYAIESGNIHVVNYVLKRNPRRNLRLLITAIRFGNLEILETIHNLGIWDTDQLLTNAIEHANSITFKYLWDRTSAARDLYNDDARINIIEQLLDHTNYVANPDIHRSVMQWFVARADDPTIPPYTTTLLIDHVRIALVHNNYEMLLFISENSGLTLPYGYLDIPIDTDIRILELLTTYRISLGEVLWVAVMRNEFELVCKIIETPTHPHIDDEELCMLAARANNFKMVKYLHEAGFEIDERQYEIALMHGNYELFVYAYENHINILDETCLILPPINQMLFVTYVANVMMNSHNPMDDAWIDKLIEYGARA